MMIRIVTDSTCDLPAEVIAKYGIRVVPLYINIGDKGYLDGVEITREEFYRNLPTYPVHPTTAASSPEKYRKVYDELAREGATQVLSIHISSALSAVIDTARVAAQETKSVPVTVFDSRQLSLGTGFLVETAAKLAAQGKTMGEIVKALNDQIKRSHVFAALDTLEFLKRSGRMNGMIAAMGTLLQLKPILTMFDGKAGAERVRTRERATQRLLEMLHDVGNVERIAIVHTHSPERVAELRKQAAHLLPDGEILSMDITPIIGAHIGPGAVGFAIVGKSKG
ncbi:MAG: DegV family protein [Chloroflexi bacterium]|nr:DegV family protein [Chloroflexota bacterium]